ncbi:nucleoside triphosphate pyrophosphohydrolase [Candidatus Fermentibacteria bacterium]|nr:nucleoside triphosphate pyrophosphohydrolase [Candidatus Fermentibacteria bacterium]
MADGLDAIGGLVGIVRTLRGPGGCEWDRSQTVASLRPFLLEEAYEAADAAEKEDWDALRQELGDLLLHVVMAAVIAEESGRFDLEDVARGISEKLVRRHPHVFSEPERMSPGEVERQWEAIKSSEKEREGFFASIPGGLPALQTAWRIQQRAAEVGFDWPDADGALEKLLEEIEECRAASSERDRGGLGGELADMLFSTVNYTRLMGFEPEQLLRSANRKFIDRFAAMEELLGKEGVSLSEASASAMNEAWETVKTRGAGEDGRVRG